MKRFMLGGVLGLALGAGIGSGVMWLSTQIVPGPEIPAGPTIGGLRDELIFLNLNENGETRGSFQQLNGLDEIERYIQERLRNARISHPDRTVRVVLRVHPELKFRDTTDIERICSENSLTVSYRMKRRKIE